MKKVIILLAGVATLLSTYSQAQTCNVIVSSTKSFENAQKIQKDYAKKFDDVNIVKNSTGWFMVSVAKVDKKVATKTVKKWKKIKKIPKDSLYSCKNYQEVTKAVNKDTKQTKKQPNVVAQFNQAYFNYEKLKKAFVDYYDVTIKLQAKSKSLTKEEAAEYTKRVQTLKGNTKGLIQGFNIMANLYTQNTKVLTAAKDGDKISPYLKQEKSFVLEFLKKIEALK